MYSAVSDFKIFSEPAFKIPPRSMDPCCREILKTRIWRGKRRKRKHPHSQLSLLKSIALKNRYLHTTTQYQRQEKWHWRIAENRIRRVDHVARNQTGRNKSQRCSIRLMYIVHCVHRWRAKVAAFLPFAFSISCPLPGHTARIKSRFLE